MSTPTIIAYIDSEPEIEALLPLLQVLQSRGRIQTRALCTRRQLRSASTFRALLLSSGVPIEGHTQLRLKRFFKRDIARADAALVLSDPHYDRSKRWRRTRFMSQIGLPTVFLQHGAIQQGVNFPMEGLNSDLHSALILLWQCGEQELGVLPPASHGRLRQIGFTKRAIWCSAGRPPLVRKWITEHNSRLLVCQSLKWAGSRYGDSDRKSFYELLGGFLSSNPSIGVLLRPHRGKTHPSLIDIENDLESRHSNLLISRSRSGALKRWSIYDCIDACTCVATPASTAVLDAAYSGKPVALFDDPTSAFPELLEVHSVDDLALFARQPEAHVSSTNKVRARFGDLEENLRHAAQVVEDLLIRDHAS